MSSTSKPTVNIWQYKPWWCQPWSILLTGMMLIGLSWVLRHSIWVTMLVAVPVVVWMGYFLVVYPQLMAQSGLFPSERTPDSEDSP